MKSREQEPARFHLRAEDADAAAGHVEDLLSHYGITNRSVNDAKLVFGALFQEFINQGYGEDTEVEVSAHRQIGGSCLIIGFEGKVFTPPSSDDGNHDRFILCSLGDKVSYRYRTGYNTIRISVMRSYFNTLFFCALAAILAMIAYLPINFLIDPVEQDLMLVNYVLPIEQLYINAILMVGAPVTLFSLLKNLTDTYIVSGRHSGIRGLQVKTLITSILAILLAAGTAYIVQQTLGGLEGYESELGAHRPDATFAEVIPALVPSGIFKPFDDLSPVPLIAVSLLVTYALCSIGQYFDAMKKAVDACYALFSRMLHAIIMTLPLFCFIAFIDIMLDDGYSGVADIALYLALAAFSPVVLLASYAIRLRAHGIKVVPFAKKVFPLLRENFKIGSAITAAPLNIRYCVDFFGMDRTRLSRIMPVLAELNLDGNCFLIMFGSVMLVFVAGAEISTLDLFVIGLLVLFLSLGAPNQPGSMLIGSLIVATYLNSSSDAVTMSIYLEAFLGNLQNLINVTGDIVMAAIVEGDSASSTSSTPSS